MRLYSFFKNGRNRPFLQEISTVGGTAAGKPGRRADHPLLAPAPDVNGDGVHKGNGEFFLIGRHDVLF